MKRLEIAIEHYRFKMSKPSVWMDNLGMMSIEEFSSTVMRGIYPVEEVESAILSTYSEGLVDLYYELECSSCKHKNYFRELKFPDVEKFLHLFTEGESCEVCGRQIKTFGDFNSTPKKYAISNNTLSKIPEPSLNSSKQNEIGQRIKSLFKKVRQ